MKIVASALLSLVHLNLILKQKEHKIIKSGKILLNKCDFKSESYCSEETRKINYNIPISRLSDISTFCKKVWKSNMSGKWEDLSTAKQEGKTS